MANRKVNLLDRKEPLNLSVRGSIKQGLIESCNHLGIDKNALVESFISEYLKELKYKDYDPTK